MSWRGSHEISRCSWTLIVTQERLVQFSWDAALDRIFMLQCMAIFKYILVVQNALREFTEQITQRNEREKWWSGGRELESRE